MLTFHVIPLFLVIASEAWNLKVCACAMILDSSLRSATFRMTECQHYLEPRIQLRGSIPSGAVQPLKPAGDAVPDFVEICLLQGLRYYEISRAVIIRSVGRPKFVCVGAAPAQLRGVRFS